MTDEPWFFEYAITILINDFIDNNEDNNTPSITRGVIFVEDGSYKGAMDALCNYYGEEYIVCINYLAPVLPGPVVEYDSKLNCLVEFAHGNNNKNEFKYLFKGEKVEVCE